MAKVIAINGIKRSGKNTVGNIIAGLLPEHVQQVGFADKLKVLGARSLGFKGNDAELLHLMNELKDQEAVIDVHYTYRDKPDVSGTNSRRFLQHLGSDARELLGCDLWVDQVLPPLRPMSFSQDIYTQIDHVLREHYPDTDTLIITDLRFENEAKRVKQYDGTILEVVRPGLHSDGHVSELRLPEYLIDHRIDNGGDLSDLRSAVHIALQAAGLHP